MSTLIDDAAIGAPSSSAVAPLPPLDVVRLADGLKIGATVYHELHLRGLTARDLLDAQDAAEKVVAAKDGLALVSSPARMGMELLRRQIKCLTEDGQTHNGPLGPDELGRLSVRDLSAVQAAADALDALDALRAGEGATRRGRNTDGHGAA